MCSPSAYVGRSSSHSMKLWSVVTCSGCTTPCSSSFARWNSLTAMKWSIFATSPARRATYASSTLSRLRSLLERLQRRVKAFQKRCPPQSSHVWPLETSV